MTAVTEQTQVLNVKNYLYDKEHVQFKFLQWSLGYRQRVARVHLHQLTFAHFITF